MTAKNVRLVLAAVVSIYGVVSAAVKTNGLHLPPAVSAVLVAAAPIMLAVQHWLSDPSTGNPAPPAPTGRVSTATMLSDLAMAQAPMPVGAPAPQTTGNPTTLTITGGQQSGIPAQPQPAPVPPPEWSTMTTPAPQAPPNPAPPAPGA